MTRRRYQKGCLVKKGGSWVLRYREDVLNLDGSPGRVHRSMIQEVGLCSQRYFGVVFQKFAHMSPYQYRKRRLSRAFHKYANVTTAANFTNKFLHRAEQYMTELMKRPTKVARQWLPVRARAESSEVPIESRQAASADAVTIRTLKSGASSKQSLLANGP